MNFERIYQEHFRQVWRFLARLGVPERDLPDAAQDVFVVVHRKLQEFEGRSRIETWLYGICVRVASDRRRRASQRWESLEHPDEQPSGVTLEPGDERLGLRALAERILGSLPLEQRAVFVCFELEGLSSQEVAERLQIPLGTVHSRLRLARAGFRKELARLGAREARWLRAGGQD
ncbi:MAG: sigma-70 family RNA polymerase sigma factor [Polyangiaceae bacterium]